MKRHYQIISKIKQSILLSIFCMGLFTLQAQKLTSKDESIEKFKFDLPTDNHFNRKTYQKGTGKSFINFGDILISRAVLPAASFSNEPSSGQHINQGLINQQPIQGFPAILNNYDRTLGMGLPDDNKFILLWLDQPLERQWGEIKPDKKKIITNTIKVYPNTFRNEIIFFNTVKKETLKKIISHN